MDDQGKGGNDEKEAGNGALGAPIQSFKAGVADLAEHHEAEEEEKSGQGVLEVSNDPIRLVVLEEQESDGGDKTSGGWDGKTGKVF